jgi:homogentisate 1,2-dioxygenase
MAAAGIELESESLVLTKGRDFVWSYQNLDQSNQPADFPAGELFFEFSNGEQWDFVITDDMANIKVESTDVALVPRGTKWQLVFLEDGEAAGGQAVARGTVRVQGE